MVVRANAFRSDSDGRNSDIARYSSLGMVEKGPSLVVRGALIFAFRGVCKKEDLIVGVVNA